MPRYFYLKLRKTMQRGEEIPEEEEEERAGRNQELFDHGSGHKENKNSKLQSFGPNAPQVNFCFLKRCYAS